MNPVRCLVVVGVAEFSLGGADGVVEAQGVMAQHCTWITASDSRGTERRCHDGKIWKQEIMCPEPATSHEIALYTDSCMAS